MSDIWDKMTNTKQWKEISALFPSKENYAALVVSSFVCAVAFSLSFMVFFAALHAVVMSDFSLWPALIVRDLSVGSIFGCILLCVQGSFIMPLSIYSVQNILRKPGHLIRKILHFSKSLPSQKGVDFAYGFLAMSFVFILIPTCLYDAPLNLRILLCITVFYPIILATIAGAYTYDFFTKRWHDHLSKL